MKNAQEVVAQKNRAMRHNLLKNKPILVLTKMSARIPYPYFTAG
ncbi:hypothetical protein [Stanieria cyanosphaera]|nr:hypothetical protein [Stanieria cyanosphaera]